MDSTRSPLEAFSRVPITLTAITLTACGGGGDTSGNSAQDGSGSTPAPPAATIATAGVWKGSLTSSASGQSTGFVGMVDTNGHGLWMTTAGHVFEGRMPQSGTRFESHMAAHANDEYPFHDGSTHGAMTMMVDDHASATMQGRHSGTGDSGTFTASRSPMWMRAASLDDAAGVYTRTTSSGYAMTMTISANGQMQASDSTGCTISGDVTIPDPARNLYRIDAIVTSCGDLDGTHHGAGSLLDADAMRDWMTAMHPLQHGTHMMGGSHQHGHNTVPGGQRNLFMFSIANEQHAIMDALAR